MVTIGRRGVLQAAAALAAPAVVAAEATRVMRFIPQIDLVFIDPHTSTTNITRNHSGLVFDQLWGTDSNYRAQPQMVDGHVVEDDGLTWRIRLRDGLRWHDGAPVLARDCVASIRRWGARDVLGMEILAMSNEISYYRVSPEAPLPTTARSARQTRRVHAGDDAGTAGAD
jgi:peptide/nickel transport system substrate-binding protein